MSIYLPQSIGDRMANNGKIDAPWKGFKHSKFPS